MILERYLSWTFRLAAAAGVRLRRGLAESAIDVLQQRIDGSPAPSRICAGPQVGAEACTRSAFSLFLEVGHRLVDDCDTCAFGDGIPGAQNPRRPCVVA